MKSQRGAALLLAMLIVALVSSLAAAATWQQRRSVQEEADERAQMQSTWLVRGALDWAKIILVLDAEADSRLSSPSDHYNEPWAVPLSESKLGTFLTAENNIAQDANADLGEAFFSGAIIDLDGRLNFANLIQGQAIHPETIQQFQRLFTSLGLPPEQVPLLAERYLDATRRNPDAQSLFAPSCVEELTWLGLNTQQIERLRPYVTVLPTATKININTVSERVLAAMLPEEQSTAAARLVALRNQHPVDDLQAAQSLLSLEPKLNEGNFAVSSEYFLVSGHMRLDDLEVQNRYLLHRKGRQLRTVRQECSDLTGKIEVAPTADQ